MSYQVDFFAGIEEKVLAAIGTKVQYPAYVFVRDKEASATGRLAFVDQNNVLKYIRGENKQHVVNVTTLPDVASGDEEVLYIMDGIVYVFDGTKYNPAYKDHSEELSNLTQRVDALEATTEEIQATNAETTSKIVELENETDIIAEQLAELEEKVATLDDEQPESNCEHLYEKIKYEISHKPVGTLVDYREKEIRIMCPEDTEWVLQNVGPTGDSTQHYLGFKAYAPEEAVSFKEDLAEVIADDTMYYFEDNDFAGVDAYGRKYSICWLAAAHYENDVWTYYGASSSKERYIGWYYSVEWYNSDGVVIASDCIRINLSNEACHSAIEPYYMAGVPSEIESLKDANASVIEKVDTITEQLTDIEERIVEIEKETFTFVELE